MDSVGDEKWDSLSVFFGLPVYSKFKILFIPLGFPGGPEVKASAWNAGDLGLIPGSGRSPGEGNDNPFQYSCLENPMEGGTWWATVHGVAKSDTTERIHFTLYFYQNIRPEVWHFQIPLSQIYYLHKSLLFFKQSSCFNDSLRISLIIYYLPLVMCPIANLWLHCNSCYIHVYYLSS